MHKKHSRRSFSIDLAVTIFFAKALTSAASSSYVEELDKSFPKSKTCFFVSEDSVNKHKVNGFLSLVFLAHDAEIRWAVKDVLSHFSSRSNASMRSLFLSMFTDNAFVKEYSMSKDKVSYYVNYEIASAFRNEMLLTCVKC